MFTYADLLKEAELFCRRGVETGVIGQSELGQRIPYIFIGDKKGPALIVQGAIHAREHITALLVLSQAKHLLKRPDLLLRGGIYFIPMANPDGVRLAQEGVGWIENKRTRKRLIEINGGKNDFSLWKANANGVDINVNFDARWAQGDNNKFYRGSESFVGSSVESETETRNLVNFTLAVRPQATISYHCKGEEIYWRFSQKKLTLWQHYRLAKAVADKTGYKLVKGQGSCGGYKDWCIDKLNIPSLTVEVGSDKFDHPYPYADFENILYKNVDIPRRFLNSVAQDLEQRRLAYAKRPMCDGAATAKSGAVLDAERLAGNAAGTMGAAGGESGAGAGEGHTLGSEGHIILP